MIERKSVIEKTWKAKRANFNYIMMFRNKNILERLLVIINIIGKLVYLTSYLNENMLCEDSFIQQISIQCKVIFYALKIKEEDKKKS